MHGLDGMPDALVNVGVVNKDGVDHGPDRFQRRAGRVNNLDYGQDAERLVCVKVGVCVPRGQVVALDNRV